MIHVILETDGYSDWLPGSGLNGVHDWISLDRRRSRQRTSNARTVATDLRQP